MPLVTITRTDRQHLKIRQPTSWSPPPPSWHPHPPLIAVARNLCAGGGQARGVPETPVSRGVWGHGPPENFQILKPWNAISGSHFKILPNPGNDFLTEIIRLHTQYSQNVQIRVLVSIILQWCFFDWGGGGGVATATLAPPASYGHATTSWAFALSF